MLASSKSFSVRITTGSRPWYMGDNCNVGEDENYKGLVGVQR